MRNAGHASVNTTVMICFSESELQFALGLLTQLKSDDLITENRRCAAILELVSVLARVRDVTKNKSSVSQGEGTEQ